MKVNDLFEMVEGIVVTQQWPQKTKGKDYYDLIATSCKVLNRDRCQVLADATVCCVCDDNVKKKCLSRQPLLHLPLQKRQAVCSLSHLVK